jgi:hypothetical protein
LLVFAIGGATPVLVEDGQRVRTLGGVPLQIMHKTLLGPGPLVDIAAQNLAGDPRVLACSEGIEPRCQAVGHVLSTDTQGTSGVGPAAATLSQAISLFLISISRYNTRLVIRVIARLRAGCPTVGRVVCA